MKRTRFCGFFVTAALACVLPVQAARTVPVQVDGERLTTAGYLDRGITYVPLRSLLNAFGGWELTWDASAGQAVATCGANQLTADPASNTVTVDGAVYTSDVSIQNGQTYVPLRTVAEACGSAVGWDRLMGGATVTTAGAEYAAEDLYWLSRIISAESRGESTEGQIAVGNVVLRRRAAPEFPDTIRGVVFDRVDGVQFEPVSNGTVYLEPTPQALESARRVLAGEQVIDGCLYFYAPALSPGTWINANRTYVQTIGCHRFYR